MALKGNHYLTEGQIESLRPRVTFSLAALWTIERTDGEIFRFASHDKWIRHKGDNYKPIGPSFSSINQGESGRESDMEATGFLSDETVRASDIHAGKYDNAKITQLIVDWEKPWRWVKKNVWWIKTITENSSVFSVQLQGSERFWTLGVGKYYENDCTKVLGGADCGATTVRTQFACVVDGVSLPNNQLGPNLDGRSVFSLDPSTFTVDSQFPHIYDHGTLTFTDGPNRGTSREIARQEGNVITLLTPAPFALKAGDMCTLKSGCDGSPTTCNTVYSNAERFGGLPFMPTAEDSYRRPDEDN